MVLTKGLLWVSHTSGIFLFSLACFLCLSVVCLPAYLPAYHLCIYLFCVLWLLLVRYEQMSTCSISRAWMSAEECLMKEWVYCDLLLGFTCGAWRAQGQLHLWKAHLPRAYSHRPFLHYLKAAQQAAGLPSAAGGHCGEHCEPRFRDFLRLGSCLLPKPCKFCPNEPPSKLACFNMKEFLHHSCLSVCLSYVSKRESQGWCLCFVHFPHNFTWVKVMLIVELTCQVILMSHCLRLRHAWFVFYTCMTMRATICNARSLRTPSGVGYVHHLG